jgi:hypothetical protein
MANRRPKELNNQRIARPPPSEEADSERQGYPVNWSASERHGFQPSDSFEFRISNSGFGYEIMRIGMTDHEPTCLVEGLRRVLDREVELHFHRVVPSDRGESVASLCRDRKPPRLEPERAKARFGFSSRSRRGHFATH